MNDLIVSASILLAYAALPAAWGLRAWAATGVVVAFLYVIFPVTPFQEAGPFYGLGVLVLAWLFVLASVGVGLRVVWAMATARSLQIRPPPNSVLYRADSLLSALVGLAVGTILTLQLAIELRGMSGGLTLHLAVAALFAAAAVTALLLSGRLRPLTVSALATIAGLTLAGGTLYPALILAEAATIRPDNTRCLRTPTGTAPDADQLRLLTLPLAQPRRPNLVLTVMTEDGQRDFRWSYRSFAFRTYESYDGGPCPE